MVSLRYLVFVEPPNKKQILETEEGIPLPVASNEDDVEVKCPPTGEDAANGCDPTKKKEWQQKKKGQNKVICNKYYISIFRFNQNSHLVVSLAKQFSRRSKARTFARPTSTARIRPNHAFTPIANSSMTSSSTWPISPKTYQRPALSTRLVDSAHGESRAGRLVLIWMRITIT